MTVTFMASFGFRERSKIVVIVGTAMAARISAGTTAHANSSRAFPWICTGSGASGLARYLMTNVMARVWTSTKITAATMNTGLIRLSIWRATGPFGLRVSWGAFLAHDASNMSSGVTAAATRQRLFTRKDRPCAPRLTVVV